MTRKVEFEVRESDGLIVVREPFTRFFAIYSKHFDQPKLVLRRCSPTKDHALIEGSRQAANDKARELGWIV